jgi:hypothetical protein
MTLKLEKRVQIVLPVRVAVWNEGCKPVFQMGCTYDVSINGARLTGFKGGTAVGDILVVQRAKSRALYRVMWVGKPGTPHHDQIGVHCIEPEKMIWEANLSELVEQYEPVLTRFGDQVKSEGLVQTPAATATVYVFSENSGRRVAKGNLIGISHQLCKVKTQDQLGLQTAVQILITSDSFDVRMRGCVQSCDKSDTLSLALHAIRRGDRRAFSYMLAQRATATNK